ncbi:MAG: hypothetical protein WAK55_33320 [Xanthobacteraceae bacterium]
MEVWLHSRAMLVVRTLRGVTTHSVAIALSVAATACLALSACSPGADYPSLYPAVHDMPAPRTDATLDTQQVQQATEDLISDRNRLSSEARSGPAKAPLSLAPQSPNSVAAAKKAKAKSPPSAAARTQTAGAETK